MLGPGFKLWLNCFPLPYIVNSITNCFLLDQALQCTELQVWEERRKRDGVDRQTRSCVKHSDPEQCWWVIALTIKHTLSTSAEKIFNTFSLWNQTYFPFLLLSVTFFFQFWYPQCFFTITDAHLQKWKYIITKLFNFSDINHFVFCFRLCIIILQYLFA